MHTDRVDGRRVLSDRDRALGHVLVVVPALHSVRLDFSSYRMRSKKKTNKKKKLNMTKTKAKSPLTKIRTFLADKRILLLYSFDALKMSEK
jgi:hypothetical protein